MRPMVGATLPQGGLYMVWYGLMSESLQRKNSCNAFSIIPSGTQLSKRFFR
jgi:hypothetical protein